MSNEAPFPEVPMLRKRPPGRARLLLLVAAATTAACATASPAPPMSSPGDRGPEGARVMVRNPHWEDLTIYLDREGTLLRLGVVPGNESRTLGVSDIYLRANCWGRLIAMTIGRDEHAASEVFGLAAGDYLVWEVGLVGRSTPVRLADPPPT